MHVGVWFTKHFFTDKKDKNQLFDKKNSLKWPINKMSAIFDRATNTSIIKQGGHVFSHLSGSDNTAHTEYKVE